MPEERVETFVLSSDDRYQIGRALKNVSEGGNNSYIVTDPLLADETVALLKDHYSSLRRENHGLVRTLVVFDFRDPCSAKNELTRASSHAEKVDSHVFVLIAPENIQDLSQLSPLAKGACLAVVVNKSKISSGYPLQWFSELMGLKVEVSGEQSVTA